MEFDAIVIGGGHAGIEASLALARLGFHTLMITQNLDTIGKMSCNPAVGGLAKGNMVREIDALGGQMGKLIDETMIQFRVLNRRKGPAVQSPRAQADKVRYQLLAKKTLEDQKGLELFMDTVVDFVVEDRPDPERGNAAAPTICGVVTERGKRFRARTVVLTTGTFLNGKVFIGEYRAVSGRLGEPAALGLDVALQRLGFVMGRMKTGTPARVFRDSIDLSSLEQQWGDEDLIPFSFTPGKVSTENVCCYVTYTTEETHRIIRDNMHRSPLYSGEIKGLGPRYCPSIEDKVVKFPHRPRHQIFIEPEGSDTREMYLNGMSSSLPEEVQEEFIHSLPGFSQAVIMRPGYAVEYDYMDPSQLYPSLETKKVRGLFVAGQTNGTSGYEEAAAQGLMAGINAGRYLKGEEAIILTRAEAYIGVLIDDLVTMGTREPYRMFTSRAEHRISLRHDSADFRLFQRSWDLGLHSPEERARYLAKKQGIDEIKEALNKRSLSSADILRAREEAAAKAGFVLSTGAGAASGVRTTDLAGAGGVTGTDSGEILGVDPAGNMADPGRGIRIGGGRRHESAVPAGDRPGEIAGGKPGPVPKAVPDRELLDWDEVFPRDKAPGKTFWQLLKSPRVTMEDLVRLSGDLLAKWPLEWLRQVELDVKYEGYVARQEEQILRFNRMEEMKIPRDFDYDQVKSLSNESREKLKKIQPVSMGQASRINGVRNSDLAILMVSVARRGRQKPGDQALSEEFLESSKLKEAEAFVSSNRLEVPEAGDDDGEA